MVTFLKKLTHIWSPLQRFVNTCQTVIQGNKKDKISFEPDIFMLDKISFLWACQRSRFKILQWKLHAQLICISSIDSVDKKQQFFAFCGLPKNAFCTPFLSTESIDDAQRYCAWSFDCRILDVESGKTHT